MGKMFQNASSLKTNCPGMIIGRSSVFYADRKSKMAATTGHSINIGPYGENTEICSRKLLHCICFLPSFSSYGWGVSGEKIKMWKVNGRQTTDDKWWQKLTFPLARWAKKVVKILILLSYILKTMRDKG
jgi:hypothetical protein